MESRKLKILCFGAGAIGSYVGGSLAIKGHEVHFLDRPETLAKIKENGIHLHFSEKKHHLIPDHLWTSIDEATTHNKFDFSIVAVKSYDTDSLLLTWNDKLNLIPPVLCLQNGVENEMKIRSLIGREKTISGTVTTAIGRIENGIVVERLRGIGIENKNSLSDEIIIAMKDAGLNAERYQDADSMKWSKLLTNLTTNASSAILGMTPAEILSNKGLFKIEIEQLRETLRVMKALNLKTVNLPATPVKIFGIVIEKFPLSISSLILRKFISGGRGGKMPSFYLDLRNHRGKSEVDYLNGAVVRFGTQVKISTPVNDLLTKILIKMTEGEIQISTFEHNPTHFINQFSGLQ